MCVGVGVAGIVSILSTVASGVGTVVGMASQNAALQAQQQQDRNNEVIAKRNAEDARERGIVAEQEQQLKTRGMIGKQINILSERSIDVGSGSALDVIGDTAMFGKLDALTTRANFEREAIGHETQAMNFAASAEQRGLEMSANKWGAGASLFATALGGASDLLKVNPRGSMSL